MKNLYLLVFTLCFFTCVHSQEVNKQPELNCYNKWALKFDERGADDVADGAYTDVIISIRTGANAECFQGKAIVKDKKVESFYVLLEDGTYEQVIRVWKTEIKDISISNGISKTLITKDNQLVNILWPKKIKPKKAGFKKAPEPTDD